MSSPETFLPHRGPAVLLDEIRATDPERCIAVHRVKAGAPYLDAAGHLPAWVGLELMALTAAAYSGRRNLLAGRAVRVGYLLGTRAFTTLEPGFPPGTELEIEARVRFLDASGPSAFDCEIRRAGALVASATLKAIEP